MKNEIFHLVDVLHTCGLDISRSMMSSCAPLLSLLRRKLKFETAFIVFKNANRILFDQEPDIGKQNLIVSADILEDGRMTEDNRVILYHHIRCYLGTTITLDNGKRGTVLCGCSEPRDLSSDEISLFCDLAAMMEERFQQRRMTDVDTTVANLTICSVLLSSIKAYLDAANSCICKMDYEYQHILSENPRLMARGYNSIGDCAKRLDMINLHLSTAIERALAVAQHYTVKNKKDYIMSCFQHESVGFVKSMNEVLLRLSNLMPDHNIMWSFRLDASLARCPHRTFSSHLLFFLEGLVFRWAPYCSSAHISLTFESRGKIQYSAPKIHHKHATRVLQITNRCMLRQAVYANPHEMYHHLSSTFDNGDESDDDDDNASTHSAGSSSIYSDKRLNLNLSVNTKPAKCKGEIEHGYLKIIFQPMDITYASKGSPRSRLGNSPMGGKSRKTTNKLPTPQNSPIAKSRKTMESPSKVENEPSPPSKPTALEEFDQQMEQKHRNPNLQEIERAISSLREEETNYLMSTHALSPYTTTRELMHVMDDFLRAIDPNAHASLASAEYFPLLPEPGNIAFMITLPCYFTLPHDQEKPVRYTPASRPNVSKSLSSSFDAAQTPTYDNTTGVSPLLSRTRTSSSDGDSETPVAGYRPHKVFHSRGRMVSSRIFSLKETEEDETESSQVIINSTYGHQSQPILPQRAETEIPSQKSVTKSASLGAKLKLGSEKESKGISNKSSKPRPSEIAATYPSAATTPTSTYYSTPSTPIGTIGSAVNRFISTVVSSVNMFLNVTPRNTVAPEPLGRAFRSNTVSSDTPPSSEQATPDGRAHPIDTPAFVF